MAAPGPAGADGTDCALPRHPKEEAILDSDRPASTLQIMTSTRLAVGPRPPPCPHPGLLLALALPLLATADPPLPQLEFLAPTNGALFSTSDEVPILLRAVAANDVFLSAELQANNQPIATLLYCCPWCPCPRPPDGQETLLQIPAPGDPSHPPSRLWQGWTNVPARTWRLTAAAVGEAGTILQAQPVTITVLDRRLELDRRPDGSVALRIPEGSMVQGHYDLEASADLVTWTRLGPFQPGDVAAFYLDLPPAEAPDQRYYRSVYVPP